MAGATVLTPTGANKFFGNSTVNQKADTKTKKSGGGGGGSNKDKNKNFRDSNVATEVERMLDLMSQVNTIQQSQQNYYQSQQKYYTQTGQLQGTIAYMQKEKEVLEAQNPVLEENIKRIEQYMEAKKAEIATLSTDDEAYKDVADDLDKLLRRIMAEVYRKHNVLLTAIGVYSVNTKDPDAFAAREAVSEIVTAAPYVLQMHGFYLDKAEKTLRFDIVVSFDAPDRSRVYREVCEAVQRAYPDYTLQVAMDTDFSEETEA
jgi:hypothetical protein